MLFEESMAALLSRVPCLLLLLPSADYGATFLLYEAREFVPILPSTD